MRENKNKILASCLECGCDAPKIQYHNSGPSIRVICLECDFYINEMDARKKWI